MAADIERVVNGGVAGEKTSRQSGRSKPLHPPLSSSYRHVRTFRSVIRPLAPTVEVGEAKVAKCGAAGAISVSDDRSGHAPLGRQQLAHQA